ncbi:hypothetical protein K504DRAFT_241661 [Pleomassaria siparia CBS 279.74]|uniref:Uncharacterized protein n=1 Tax=Pleomassaria siparia CBS 279.74 TaxID=1314801 RepID=A0A6G1KE13_9PLEO|nr:hypothetical protein K504DRAFT_241661 [Pleomassaria siparia CBS 279.74]
MRHAAFLSPLRTCVRVRSVRLPSLRCLSLPMSVDCGATWKHIFGCGLGGSWWLARTCEGVCYDEELLVCVFYCARSIFCIFGVSKSSSGVSQCRRHLSEGEYDRRKGLAMDMQILTTAQTPCCTL